MKIDILVVWLVVDYKKKEERIVKKKLKLWKIFLIVFKYSILRAAEWLGPKYTTRQIIAKKKEKYKNLSSPKKRYTPYTFYEILSTIIYIKQQWSVLNHIYNYFLPLCLAFDFSFRRLSLRSDLDKYLNFFLLLLTADLGLATPHKTA